MGTITLLEYIQRVQRKLDDTAFNGAILTDFANDTNRDICNSAPWSFMESTFSGTLTQGDYGYDLSASIPDLQQLISLELTAPNRSVVSLTYMPYQEFVQRYPNPGVNNQTAPCYWSVFASELLFDVPVDQAYTILTRYIKVPTTASSDGDTFDIPDDFSEVLVLGMYARALEQIDQPDYATPQYQRMLSLIANMKIRNGQRQIGTPIVVPTRRSQRGVWRGASGDW